MRQFRCAVVTGASGGIGLELAKLLAPRADRLILVARNRERLNEIAAELVSPRCQVHVMVRDLEQQGAAERLWNEVQQIGVIPDLWVNNAGFGLYGKSLETSLEREQAMVQLNCISLLTLTKLAGQAMSKQGGGTILNLASVAAFQAGPRMSVYFASKAFVLSLSEAMDEECKPLGVRVLALCPGNTATAFHQVAGTLRVKAMQKAFQMDAPTVARLALRQIDKGQRVFVPGFLNRLMVFMSSLLPRRLVVAISARVLKDS